MHHLFYHANCADGFSAACIARQALIAKGEHPDTLLFHPVNYGDSNQVPVGDDHLRAYDQVTWLDYTPPQDVIDTLVTAFDGTLQITILDHHSSAAPRHGIYTNAPEWTEPMPQPQLPFRSVFHLHRSGASLAWEHFCPGQDMPMALQLIEHRDLGHAFQSPNTAPGPASLDLHAYLFRCIPRTVEAWTPILLASWAELEPLCNVGARLRAADACIIASAVHACHWLDFSNLSRIPAVNGLDAGLISDACTKLLEAYPSAPFAASWFINAKTGQAVYSLRSRKPGHPDGHVNVAEVAVAMAPGGGGHPCAAGFSTSTPLPFAS